MTAALRRIGRQQILLAFVEIATTIALVGLVYLLTVNSRNPFVPPLTDVLSAFRHNFLFAKVGSDVVPSVLRMLVGFFAAGVLGVGFGIVLGLMPALRLTFRPIINFFRSIPIVALVPVAILLFGFGERMKISLIVGVCIWPILLSTEDGVADVDTVVRDSARAYSIRGWSYLWFALLPATMPRIFSGMKTSLSHAVLLVVIAELFASSNGLGFLVNDYAHSFQITDMWSAVLLLGLLGFLLNFVFQVVERHVLAWHFQRRGIDV